MYSLQLPDLKTPDQCTEAVVTQRSIIYCIDCSMRAVSNELLNKSIYHTLGM